MNELEREALQYDVEALRLHVGKRQENIAILEKAVADERAGIRRDQDMIAFLEARKGEGTR